MILADSPQTVVSARAQKAALPWVTVRKSLPGAVAAPYFELETGATFTPIGQNDAITWPELVDLLRRKDSLRAEAYIRMLAGHSVTVLRLMLEYSQFDRSCFERPAGKPQPDMVRLWDDIFALCEENGIRVLLTPFDTFW